MADIYRRSLVINAKSILEIERKLKQGSKDINDYLELGSLYLDEGEHDKLLALYDQIIELPLKNIEKARVYYERGQALQFLDNKDEAISSLKTSFGLLETEQNSIDSLDLKGIIQYNFFLLSIDTDLAQQYANDAIRYFSLLLGGYPAAEDEDIYHIYSHLADIYEKLGYHKKALKYYQQALKKSRDTNNVVWIMNGIASIYAAMGKFDKASQYYNEALNRADETIPVSKIHFDMGKMYFDLSLYDQAEDSFRYALEKRIKDPQLKKSREYEVDIYWYLGTIAYETDDYKNIEICFDNVLENINDQHPYYSNSYLTLGHYNLMNENFRKAWEYYNKVLTAPQADDEEKKVAKESLTQIPFNA